MLRTGQRTGLWREGRGVIRRWRRQEAAQRRSSDNRGGRNCSRSSGRLSSNRRHRGGIWRQSTVPVAPTQSSYRTRLRSHLQNRRQSNRSKSSRSCAALHVRAAALPLVGAARSPSSSVATIVSARRAFEQSLKQPWIVARLSSPLPLVGRVATSSVSSVHPAAGCEDAAGSSSGRSGCMLFWRSTARQVDT